MNVTRRSSFPGIHTGSTYKDSDDENVLNGTKVCPIDNVIFVKTHAKSNVLMRNKCWGKTTLDYRKAIYLIRNPFQSTIAEFNRRLANKTSVASRADFQTERKCILIYNKAKQNEPVFSVTRPTLFFRRRPSIIFKHTSKN